MARKPKQGGDYKVLFARLRQVWTALNYGDWLDLVCETRPEGRWMRSGEHIKGQCPFHDDPGPSFVITPSKGMVKCFGCHKAFYNPITFVAALKNCSFADAIIFLRRRYGLKAVIPEALYEKVRDHELYQGYKRKLCEFFCQQLFEAIAAYPALDAKGLSWAQPTVEYIMARRLGDYSPAEPRPADADDSPPLKPADPHGIWAVITANQLLGVFPPRAVVANQFGENSEEFKFFCNYFASYVTDGFKFVGFLVLPLHDEPDSVCRFKLRSPAKDKKEMFFVEDAYEAEMGGFRGFYGLHYYRTFLGQSADTRSYADTACVVEGEFDALACIARQIRHQSDDFIVFSLGGASVQPLDRLTTYGIEKVRIVSDRDRGGDNIVKLCLEKTTADKLAIQIFAWPDEYVKWRDPADPDKRVKDPDEAIRALGYPKWARYLNSKDSYHQPHEWCYDQASADISKTAAEDIKQRSRAAIEWGKLLHNVQECNTFCAAIERSFGLDRSLLLREIRAKDEDEEAFIERLCDVLREHFHLVGVQNGEGRRRLLVTWHKESRATEQIVLNDERSVETVLSRYFGALYDFIRNKVGDPAFMSTEGEESAFSVTMRVKRYREYLNFAFLKLAQGLPSIDHAPTKAQGLHYIATTNNEMHSYLVNGRDVYHLVHRDGGELEARILDGPSDNGTIFDNSGDAWLHSVKNAEALTAQVDLPALFVRVRTMLKQGWTFRHQDLDTAFLAAYVLSLPVMTVFSRQTAIMINAEHESGKSRLTSGFLGGTGFPRINVVAHAVSMQGYTAAAIRQQRNNSSLALCLEEFEDYGGHDAKSLAVRKVLELCRDLISESQVNWSIGTTSGESRTYHLRFPLVTCAIRPLRDAASLSRFVSFELVKDPTRIDPVNALLDQFGSEGIQRTRHEVAVGLLRHMPRLRQLQHEVEKEYATGAALPPHATSRFREALYPTLAMLRLVGEEAQKQGEVSPEIPDYRAFAYAFSESRKEQLARLKVTSENEQIYETLLSSSIQIERTENRVSAVTTIRVMLADLNNLDEINKTKKGVYIDKLTECIVVNWIEATQGVLFNTRYRHETPTFLKQISERSPYHVSAKEMKNHRILDRLVESTGPCVSPELVSVFRVGHLLDVARGLHATNMAAPSGPGKPALASGNTSPLGGAANTAQSVDDIIA